MGNRFNHIKQFLEDYPGMSTTPCLDTGTNLRGNFRFTAATLCGNVISDMYTLEIYVPNTFPRAIPKVKEIGGKIPQDGDFHVNNDGTLCLGSPLRLIKIIHAHPTLSGFAEKCLIPYLYAVSFKLKKNQNFLFGELAHGESGITDDYSAMLRLNEQSSINLAMQLLGTKKRIANKKACPCGCGKKLGACSYHNILNEFRKIAPRSWFKAHCEKNWDKL